ncbi:MAG: hypothetical protein WBD16_12615 [Pyrinomonadaceae bacterium]
MARLLFINILVLIFATLVYSQQVYTPEKGSADRKVILDALRVPVEKQLKQRIVFVIDSFKVQGSWAFVSGQPMTPSGGKPNLEGTVFDGEENMFDDNFFGLLKKTGGKWKVITHALGCTDVCYVDWWRRYKAPKAIFPYTE